MEEKKVSTTRQYKDIAVWINAQPKTERPKLRAALRELRRLWKRPRRDDLLWWYETGTYVGVLLPKGKERHYGSAVVELIADHLETGRDPDHEYVPNLLYRYRNFARMYSRNEAQGLDKKRREHGLNSLHFTTLVSLKDKGLGKELLKPPKNPAPGVALRDIYVLARRWKKCHDVWFVGQKAALRRIPVKDRDENMLEELGRAVDGLIDMRDAIDEGRKQLQRLDQQVKAAIGDRSKAPSGSQKRRKKKSKAKLSQPAKGKATKKTPRNRSRQSTL